MGKDEKGEIHIGNGQHLIMKQSSIVTMKDRLVLFTGGGKVSELEVEIKADFENIPKEHQQTFIHMLSARYGGVVNCYSNTEPFTQPIKNKKRWYQFWK